ncbi:MAG: acyl carrier protein [Prevotella sp.]|jgi:acyl carrier protein|nr:acyl carrier protein [Bacteroidales bacterium]MDD6954022.1 acyl carrier protein [Prevotella sp.]MCI7597851.1 acyl carrier protein [Bacteroidales bacterium]MCI7653449.1 acyl carrier protein [Bacteroidales bacterium]MDY4229145.1 acyl carrier protein [Prevotella sp.]
MERSEIFKKVNEIFCDELDNEDIVLNDDTTADDVEEWDSLSHVQLIVAIEKAFGIKFTSNEILSWSNVGQLVDSIENRLKK